MSRCCIFLVLFFPSLAFAQAPKGKPLNPDVSLNTLVLYQNGNRGNHVFSEPRNGLDLQEAELIFTADVDPYSRFMGTFSLHQEVEVDDSTEPPTRSAEYVFEPEEVFAETIAVPHVAFKLGKFKTAFGRHNQLHTHAFPFIDAPLAQQNLLGDEGFNDVGVSAAALMPVRWFSELTVQAVSGKSEGLDYYNGKSPNSFVPVARFKNLWDLSDALTFEWGISAASGKNSDDQTTELYGSDITFKWRPIVGGLTRSLAWSTEYIARNQDRAAFKERSQGLASWLQYQFAQRWWAQVRAEYLDLESYQHKQSALIGFFPSEFSAARLQYDHLNDGRESAEQKVSLQFNFSIGAHPAHSY